MPMKSIGLETGLTEAWMEIQDLIEDYELQTKHLACVNDLIKELCQQIMYADKLLEIKSIGITTVADKSIPCDPYQGKIFDIRENR